MKQICTILVAILPMISLGQLVTNTILSPASLVQNILLGSGVTVSNITYNGTPASIGYFNGASTNLGLDEGVVMTTGTVLNTGNGPHGPNNSGGSGIDNGGGGLSLLSNLIGGINTFDAAILEFDFVPYSDSVRFNYVFGSEEYPEYVGSQFNDVFAFFISGPGISGLQNIAKLPSGQAVAINNVNAGSNATFFVNNGNGSTAPQNGSSTYIQYDGFTKVMTAESKVQCGETYHLIICIADAGDGILDSGIFLEANSLSSNTPIDIRYDISQQLFMNPDIMAEGCVSTTVTLERGLNEISSPMTIPVNVSGTAIEGVDYSNIPNSVTFPAGSSQIQFTFNAFQDGLIEGPETVQLTFPITDPCGNENPIVLNLIIEDIQPVDVEIPGEVMNCPGEQVTLTATPSGGAPPYTFLWGTGETTQAITVSPNATTTYSVTITDACLNESASDSYQVIVPVFPPLLLNETADITEICPYIPATLAANPSGGSGNYTYLWSSNFNTNLGNASTLTVIPSTTTTYTVVVTDNCGNTTTENIVYIITSPPLVLAMSPAIEICPHDSAFISVAPTGGYGQYFYNWLHSGETTAGIWVYPTQTTTYEVSVSDECQTFTVEGTTQVIIIKPTADFTSTSTTFFNNLPITFLNQSENAIDYVWDFGDGNGSTFPHPTNTYDDPGIYYVTLVAIDEKGCTDTITKPVGIEEEWYIY
ncbi:MAG: choice-of-anchor L domain-containing protein, partial [Crocinitomicaceae bacterium]|nr:choice-of-anchor L domain-containing protein [Crocinitomicaceae bacterium]